MPKNFTKEELENGRWVTMKGARIFIKDGESPEDAFARAAGKSKKPAIKKKNIASDNSEKFDADILDVATPESINKYTKRLQTDNIEDIAWDFGKENHINIDKDVIENTNARTLCMTMDTVADIKSKYGCTVLTIKNATEDMLQESPNAYAWMGQDGCLWLNPKKFGQSNEKLEHDWNEGRQNNRDYHPNSPYGARSIIAHEMGHAVFNKYIQNIMNKNENIADDFGAWENHWNECQWFVGNKNNFNKDVYVSSPAYKQLVNTFDNLGEQIREEPYLLKKWGGRINLSLIGLADKRYGYGDAISEYAGTNYHEMMAEAFADVYDNGTNASFTSKFLYNKIVKEMKK